MPIHASTNQNEKSSSARLAAIATMPLSNDELEALASQVRAEHSEAAVALACLVHLAHARLRSQNQQPTVGVTYLHNLGMACVRTYAKKIGVPWAEVTQAIRALQRAGDTAGYLHHLPE